MRKRVELPKTLSFSLATELRIPAGDIRAEHDPERWADLTIVVPDRVLDEDMRIAEIWTKGSLFQFCTVKCVRESEQKDSTSDSVNHPRFYAHASGVECIDIVENMSFCLGNAVKCVWRAGEKGLAVEDWKKARWYVLRELERECCSFWGGLSSATLAAWVHSEPSGAKKDFIVKLASIYVRQSIIPSAAMYAAVAIADIAIADLDRK